ncbi:MAG: Maf family protein [Lentisphaerota bacterium]
MSEAKRFENAEIILASASPRRREMLERAGLAITVHPSHIEEKYRGAESAEAYVLRNAEEKARHVARMIPSMSGQYANRHLVIGADTVVVLADRILEKPRDHEHARAMLMALSGRMHRVITGVCALGLGFSDATVEKTFAVATEVEFKILSESEIQAYIATGEPMDKAGAYAIQERGASMIRRINGSYTNVVGLPLSELMDTLEKDFGLSLHAFPG